MIAHDLVIGKTRAYCGLARDGLNFPAKFLRIHWPMAMYRCALLRGQGWGIFYVSGRAFIGCDPGRSNALKLASLEVRDTTDCAPIAVEGSFETMIARHAKLLFIMIVLVTLLFFVHVPSGSFQARNGPTTPVDNLTLRFALAGLLLSLVFGSAAVSRLLLNSRVGHVSPISQHSPAASSIGISLRC